MAGSAASESRRNGACASARLMASSRAAFVDSSVIAANRVGGYGWQRNFQGRLVLVRHMKFERGQVSTAEAGSMDRRVIQVDIPPAHAGITAALRRAFEAAASEPCDRDFAELLRKLN